MHAHMGGCPPMNEWGGGANHSWLLSAGKKEILLGENYSLCSSYRTIQARFHPTINMLAASWRSSQAWAPAIRGKTQLWGWGSWAHSSARTARGHCRRHPCHSQPLTGTKETLPPLLRLQTPTCNFQTSIHTVWSSHPLGHLLFNGFITFQDFFFVPVS